jgi:hypothetical protein
MTLCNRDIAGRRVQIIVHARVLSRDYTVREWWDTVMPRRKRGYWPRRGPWPIFYFWLLGPLDVRVWTKRAMRERAA